MVKTITIDDEQVLIIRSPSGAEVYITTVPGNSALPETEGKALKISGTLNDLPTGYSAGNSGYKFRKYRMDTVYVQPGIVIPHESQLPKCYIMAAGAMFWRTSYPISHPNKLYEEEENSMYWKHGEIVFNEESGEITFPKINQEVIKLWQEVSSPLLQKQLREIEMLE